MPSQVSDYVVKAYVRLRKLHKDQEEKDKLHTYTSARTLLAVLRLSQALARLRFAQQVGIEDVDEALRLLEVSKESLLDDSDRDRENDRSITSTIYRQIRDMAIGHADPIGRPRRGEADMDISGDGDAGGEELSIIDIRNRCLAKGFTESDIMNTILEVRSYILCHFHAMAINLFLGFCSMKLLTFGLELQTTLSSALQAKICCLSMLS